MIDGLVFDQKVSKAAGGPARMENAKVGQPQGLLFHSRSQLIDFLQMSTESPVSGSFRFLGLYWERTMTASIMWICNRVRDVVREVAAAVLHAARCSFSWQRQAFALSTNVLLSHFASGFSFSWIHLGGFHTQEPPDGVVAVTDVCPTSEKTCSSWDCNWEQLSFIMRS